MVECDQNDAFAQCDESLENFSIDEYTKFQ